MKKSAKKGYFDGVLAAISYGTNPLFAIPMYNMGMGVNSVLFYRYVFAALIYGIVLKFFKKTNFKLNRKEFCCLFLLAILFALSSITLFSAFQYMDSGIACTILFIYPIMVALISAVFFKEKLSKSSIFAMLITLCGIFTLNGGISGNLNPHGVALVLLSALVYAIYIVFVKNLTPIKHMKYDKLSFYVMLFGLSVFIINLNFCTELQPISNWKMFFCAIALAIFPTIISLETINIAIRLIGPTTTSILGALEPLTALFFGLLLFHEVLNFNRIIGIVLILSGVIMIILRGRFKNCKA